MSDKKIILPTYKKVLFELRGDRHMQVKMLAARRQVTMGDIFNEAIQKYIESQDK